MVNNVVLMNVYIFAKLNKLTYQEALKHIVTFTDSTKINYVYQRNFSFIRKTVN